MELASHPAPQDAEAAKAWKNGDWLLYGEMLLECEIMGLTKLLGQGGAQAVSYELQLGKPEMSPGEFHDRLFMLFRGGTTVLERAVLQEFYKRLRIEFKGRSPLIFEEYVNEAIVSKSFANTKSGEDVGVSPT